ncbi:MAG: N-acetylmuramoyl-L-alanine amidase-like domain-containing protein [Bacteroidota bacterium]
MRSLLFVFVLSLPLSLLSQTVCTQASSQRLDRTLQSLAQKNLTSKSINELMIEVGKHFINTPYVEKTLEVTGDEPLVINLMGLDCTTYLETVITLSRLAKMNRLSRAEYEKELTYLRYRDGVRNSYPSRLHYFSDWIYENEQKGIIKDITKEAGGIVYPNKPSFMSSNPHYYPQLANQDFIPLLQENEAAIKNRTYHYIPKAKVQEYEHNIQSGDIIAITISMANLDISHVGIAIEYNGRIHLMHASSSGQKVLISERPLSDYLMAHKSQTGIMLCRMQAPTTRD